MGEQRDFKKQGMRLAAALLALCLTLGLFACGQDEQDAEEPEKLWYNGIVRVFANGDYIESGDETLPALVGQGDMAISAAAGRQYFVLLDTALRNLSAEERQGPLERADTMITDKIQFADVRFEETGEGAEKLGTVYVDFKGNDQAGEGDGLSQLSGGGSLEETLLISQIVESLTHSFEEVDQVQFLIDGERVETLMGHCDAAEPYREGIFTYTAVE